MKKSLLIRLAMLFLTISTLSGCFWRAEDHESGPADYHDRDYRGDDHHDRHNDQDHQDDHGDHR